MPFAYFGIALLAGSILMLELALTRVFAVMMWHAMPHMVLSVAMMAIGAAGSLLTMPALRADEDPAAREARVSGQLCFWSVVYGLSIPFAFAIATRAPIDTFPMSKDGIGFFLLIVLYAVVAAPFLFAGCAVGLAFSRFAANAAPLYASDRGGAAAGALLAVALLDGLGSHAAVMAAGVLAVSAGTLFALGSGGLRGLLTLPPLALSIGALLALGSGALDWQLPFAPGKEFAAIERDAGVARVASTTAEVEVGPPTRFPHRPRRDIGKLGAIEAPGRLVGQDGSATTVLYEDASVIEAFPFLDDDQAGSAYEAFAARGGEAPGVLVIGGGAVVDVMRALANGARSVTAVEANGGMIAMLTQRFDAYLGGLFSGGGSAGDRVQLHHGTAASFVRGAGERYDLIQLASGPPLTALSTRAYSHAESFVYTTETVRALYEHLEEGGTIQYSQSLRIHPLRPRENLRLANIAHTALEQLGVEDATRQIAVFRGHDRASTIISKGPFSRNEIEALDRYAEAQGFWGLVFDPLDRPYALRHPGVPTEVAGYAALERAVMRDRIFGESERRPLRALLASMQQAYGRGLEGDETFVTRTLRTITKPIDDGSTSLAVRRTLRELIEKGRAAERAFDRTRNDFDALLRGPRRNRTAFARSYPYEVRPSSDDAPFYSDDYRYAWLRGRIDDRPGDATWSEYPVGQLVLLACLAQLLLLALLFVLLPLRAVRRRAVATRNRGRFFLYFAALGTGAAFVEVVLAQRMVLLLGHPTLAFTIVLPALWIFAAGGALLASRFATISRRALAGLGVLVGGVLLLHALVGPAMLAPAVGWSLPARIALVLASLAPAGLALGLPFPLGLRLLDAECPALLPWAWAVHALLGVLGVVLCLVLAMETGFSQALTIAAAIHAVGFGALATRRRASA